MKKLDNNVFYHINNLTKEIATLEAKIFELEQKLNKAFQLKETTLFE